MFERSKSRYASYCLAVVVMAGCRFGSEPPDRWIRIRITVPGFSALETEQQVTRLVESSLQGLPEIRGMESVSRTSEVVVWLRLDQSASLLNTRSQVAERLDSISWPDEALEPELLTESTGRILLVALQGDTGDATAIRATAERLAARLRPLPEVTRVLQFPHSSQVEIRVDEDRLRAYALTIEDISRIVRRQWGLPRLPIEGTEFPVQSLGTSTLDNLANTPLVAQPDGATVRLAEVAKIQRTWDDPVGLDAVNLLSDWVLVGVQVESPNAAQACSLAIDKALRAAGRPASFTSTRGLAAEQESLLTAAVRSWESMLPPGIALQRTKSREGYSELTPVPTDLCFRVTGPDLDELRRTTAELVVQFHSHSEIADVRVFGDQQIPVVKVETDADRAARFGIDRDDVTQAVQSAFGSQIVARLQIEGVPTDLVIRGANAQERAGELLAEMSIRTPSGESVPITQLCSVMLVSEPQEIWHDNTARCTRVQATARGDVKALRKSIQQALTQIRE